jgi:DNA helicase-2/ATP-dependent DNA helicase PcrA
MLDLSRLSREQRQAVVAGDGPLLIVAGPGSGKTTVLAARIAYLVTVRRFPPARILAIAFATKAKLELQLRLSTLLGEKGHEVDVATFHGFGLRIVRQWSEELGYRPGPLTVCNRDEACSLIRHAADECGNGLDDASLRDVAARLERYRLGDRVQFCPDLERLAEHYEELLRRQGIVDYPAMLALPLQLFAARPDILRLYQSSYHFLLADEFQDVSASQYALLRALSEPHHNLAVVGDPLQTLFAWRGADIRFLLDFQRDFPEARYISLDQNFRSTGRIVELANALAAALPYSRPLWTDNPLGERAILHVAVDERAEARFVAEEIARLRAGQVIQSLGEVAILFRTNLQVHELTIALRVRHLPYHVQGGGDLFSRREVRDAVAYLRLAHNPDDAVALARIVNVPPRGLGQLAQRLRERPVPARDLRTLVALSSSRGETSVDRLLALIEGFHEESKRLDPAALLGLALERTGYRDWLASQADGSARCVHLAELRKLAEQADGDLGSWLAQLQLDDEDPAARGHGERVLLTTIHGAKGGEWRVVFVVGVEEGILPHARSLRDRTGESSGVEDELRVAYVAVTRPREKLYLTCCRQRRNGERHEVSYPSRFLHSLPVQRTDRAA